MTCSACADLIDVAAVLADDHERASAEARIPPSAVVRWKAQVRARQEAARTAARPIAVAHFAAGIAALTFAAAAAVAIWSWRPALPAADLTPLAAAARQHAPLMLLVLLPWLFLAPVAAWLAFARE